MNAPLSDRDLAMAARFRQRQIIGLVMAGLGLLAAAVLKLVHVDRQDAFAFCWVVLAVGLVRAGVSTIALRRYTRPPTDAGRKSG